MTHQLSSDRWTQNHPLERVAPVSVRDSLARLLHRHRRPLIAACRRGVGRGTHSPVARSRRDFIAFGVKSCIEYLSRGSMPDMGGLLDRFSAPGEMPADTAARLHHILATMGLAACPVIAKAYSDDPEALRQALVLIRDAMDEASVHLCRALEQAVEERGCGVPRENLRFLEDLTRAASRDSLRLVAAERIPAPQGEPLLIREPSDAVRLRRDVARCAGEIGMAQARIEDLGLAVGEAVSNVIKYAGNGLAHIWSEDRTVYVHIADHGHGIGLHDIPKALTPGWSSDVSLGMGFTLMIEMTDALWLSTGSHGTTLCLEKAVVCVSDARPDSIFDGDAGCSPSLIYR